MSKTHYHPPVTIEFPHYILLCLVATPQALILNYKNTALHLYAWSIKYSTVYTHVHVCTDFMVHVLCNLGI